MKALRFSLFLPGFLLSSGFAFAATVLTPTAIRSHNNNGTSPDTPIQNDANIGLIDSSGLTKTDPSDPSTWTHTTNWYDGWQTTKATGPTNIGWTVLDFSTSISNFDDLYIWNVKETGTGVNTNAQSRGVKTFNIWYSTTPTTAATSGNYNFSTSTGWTQLGGTNTLNIGATPVSGAPAGGVNGIYDISGITARYIAIEIIENYGSNGEGSIDSTNRVGLAEIVVTIPEPSSALLIGVAGLGLLRRRRA